MPRRSNVQRPRTPSRVTGAALASDPTFLQRAFLDRCRLRGLSLPVVELRFAKPRRWRFDYAWPKAKVALEVEGGVWSRGRHVRAKGFLADMEKYNAAAALGWRLVRCVPGTLCTDATLELVASVMKFAA